MRTMTPNLQTMGQLKNELNNECGARETLEVAIRQNGRRRCATNRYREDSNQVSTSILDSSKDVVCGFPDKSKS
jgi:hypothetical protein